MAIDAARDDDCLIVCCDVGTEIYLQLEQGGEQDD